MNIPDLKITKFLKDHHVLTLATSSDNKPWCSNCFYVYLESEIGFVLTSDMETRHVKEILANCFVSGSVVLETNIIGKIQGIQFEGKLRPLDNTLSEKGKIAYIKRFPMAALMNTTLWFLEVNHFKMTDNRLGFGKKIIWKKQA